MPQTVRVFRYCREHATGAETSVTRMLNQRMGDPCKGGAAVILPADAPRPPASQPRTCDICLALVEMDLVDEATITMSS